MTLGVTEPFTTSVKVSLYAAFALALPVLLWQLWSFLAPAMEESSQRIVAVFVGIATVLFAGGLAFGYFVLMPKAIEFLTNYDDDLYDIEIRASYYFSFVTVMLIAVALFFELPTSSCALARCRTRPVRKTAVPVVSAVHSRSACRLPTRSPRAGDCAVLILL